MFPKKQSDHTACTLVEPTNGVVGGGKINGAPPWLLKIDTKKYLWWLGRMSVDNAWAEGWAPRGGASWSAWAAAGRRILIRDGTNLTPWFRREKSYMVKTWMHLIKQLILDLTEKCASSCGLPTNQHIHRQLKWFKHWMMSGLNDFRYREK